MCRVEYADSDPWTLLSEMEPQARKEHLCCECGRAIRVGEQYHFWSGLAAGRWNTYHQCRQCVAAAAWLMRECGGYVFTEVLEELVEHWEEETAFQSVWLARAIAGMRRKWLDGRMPIPVAPPVLAVSA